MVSLGDTAISLHILQLPLRGGGVFWEVKTQSAKICLNFNFRGSGGVKTQSAKICLNFNFQGGVLGSQNPKCQDLPKFQFSGGVFWEVKTQSAKICLNFNFQGGVLGSQNPKCQDLPKFQLGGGGLWLFWEVKTQSAKICLNFHFWGRGVLEPNPRTGVFWRIWSKTIGSMCFGSLACWCITDSLSHTTYVETN